MSVNIKLDGDVLTHLDVKLFNTILTKNTEKTFFRILAWYFNDIILRHPCVTCTL